MEKVNLQTGEITETVSFEKKIIRDHSKLNRHGKPRVQLDFSNAVSKTDTTGEHEADLNYITKRYAPNEVAAYLMMRNTRPEINGHDFSKEPDRQTALNEVLRLQTNFENLKPEVKKLFKSPLEFLKFIDNKANAEKLIEIGLLTKKEIEQVQKKPAVEDPLQKNEPAKT